MDYKLIITLVNGNKYTSTMFANSKTEAFRMLERQSIAGFYLIKNGGLALSKSSVKSVEIKERM